MLMKLEESIGARIDHLLRLADTTLGTVVPQRMSGALVDHSLHAELMTSARVFVRDLVGEASPYYGALPVSLRPEEWDVKTIKAVLDAIKKDFENGWLISTRGLIAAEVFSDFMEMADYFLNKGLKDAAAVIIGSTLEGHLRSLSIQHGLPIIRQSGAKEEPLKADTLNAELAKAEVYSKTQQKIVTGWLGLRNDAAHGHYDRYTNENVKLMFDGVHVFIAQTT